jgi:hypothetical protein
MQQQVCCVVPRQSDEYYVWFSYDERCYSMTALLFIDFSKISLLEKSKLKYFWPVVQMMYLLYVAQALAIPPT